MATPEKCQYKHETYDFTCDEPRDEDKKFCIFHDIHYLKGDNYKKNKEEVAKRFEKKLSEYSSNHRPLKFMGYRLPEISFRNRQFTEALNFGEATFYGLANFSEAKFSGEVDFSEAKFSGEVDFSEAKFSATALFSKTTFSELSTFIGAKFSGIATFSEAKFSDADFSEAKFSGRADFPAATFSLLYFGGATFSGEATFIGAKFSEQSIFSEEENLTKFSGRANFWKSTFSGRADFPAATFSGGVDFNMASFRSSSIFNYTKVFDDATFYNAIFLRKSDFTGSSFKRANFSETGFSKEAIFRKVTFIDEAEFSDTIFCSGADFSKSIFSNAAVFSAIFKSETFFNHIRFENPNKIIFESEDMSSVSFSDSDVTRIRFSSKVKWGGDEGFTIIEEKWLIKEVERRKKNKLKNKSIEQRNNREDESISPELVLSVYRNLRENYEFRLRYSDAGKFFIKEMELKRKYREALSPDGSKIKVKKNGWLRRNFLSLTGLYYHFSTYGESILKPTLIGVIIVGLSTLFWLMQSNPTLQPTFSTNAHIPYSNFTGLSNATNHVQLLKAFERSLADFLPIISIESDIKVGIIDFIVKIVGGALTFVLLGVALRRKFERKYTR